MQAGNLVGGDVLAYTTRILVNGTQRYATAWSADRELSGDLPAQVVAASGITQATGSISWASEKDVPDRPLNPWNPSGWLPRRGDRVEIFVSDGVTEWKRFHGLIDKTTGNLDGGFQSTLIDDFDKLSATVSHVPLLRIMPPTNGGGEAYRGIGLMALYYVDYAMRQAGFFCTPKLENNSALAVYGQGSIWPDAGSLISSASTGSHASVNIEPWGLSLSDFSAVYLSWGAQSSADPIQLTMNVGLDHTQQAWIRQDYTDTGTYVRLLVASDRSAYVSINGTNVASIALGSATIVSALVKNGVVTMRTNTGATASGVGTPTGGVKSFARVDVQGGARVAGLQISHPTRTADELISTYFVPSARIDTSSLYLQGLIDAAPTIENRSAESVLTEISDATLSALWIDELGVLQWVNSDALRNRTPSRTVTTLDDVLSLEWEDGLLGTASKVTAKGLRPAIVKGRWKTAVLARGSGSESIKSGDSLEVFLEPEAGVDWVQPSGVFYRVGGEGGIWSTANNPEYSLSGIYYTKDGGETEETGLTTTVTTAKLGLQKYLVKYVAGEWPADVEGVLASSPNAPTLWPKNRDKAMPKLVGAGKITWTDESVVATGPGGVGPELVHDVGPWGCRTDSTIMLDRFASFLKSQTSTPHPTISGLGIVPDPRLQLGDVITVKSSLIGVSLRVLITSVSESFGSGGFAMDLGVRVIDVDVTGVTYEQFNMGGNLTYAQLNVLAPTPQTYEQFNSDM